MFRNVIHHTGAEGEIITAPSLTVPDQAMTIEELLLNHTRGIALPQNKIPVFNEDFDMNIKGLDLVELEMLKEDLKEQQREGREKLKEIEKLKRKQEIDKNKEKSSENEG